MTIGQKLTLRYTAVTAVVFTVLIAVVMLSGDKTREKEFYRHLKGEAVTKAHLFLSGVVSPETMQSVYLNNREFIDEVEVAVYNDRLELVYHDANDIDIVKETPELLSTVINGINQEFYEGDYQVTALLYEFGGAQYVVTAAAVDGYGTAKNNRTNKMLIIIWLSALAVLAATGYFLSASVLRPIRKLSEEMDKIEGGDLSGRIRAENPRDEIGELTETFNDLLERLERSFVSQRMFVNNMAHELRTPISAIIAELQIANLKPRENEEYRQVLARTEEEARKLVELSGGILDLARAEYDPGSMKMKDIRVDEVLIDARNTILRAYPEFNVELIFSESGDEDSFLTVRANEYLLNVAMSNLIENNCKYSPNHKSYVQIAPGEEKIVIRFSDNGTGMSREELGKIFTPFYRGTNSAGAEGSGVGMTLVSKIIAIHKGTLTVNSRVGEGTVFTVTLPHI